MCCSSVNPWQGSIPACAGEPSPAGWRFALRRVYPRVCGGTGMLPYALRSNGGLSPRVRGNPFGRLRGDDTLGSIPACAGEPTVAVSGEVTMTVYPRVCGGTGFVRPRSHCTPGLSPRVRGNHAPSSRPAHLVRSIPACAGEPRYSLTDARRMPVYPRVCGGTGDATISRDVDDGLSPRVRGNRIT